MDGSRNVSIRNWKFLRSFTGVADIMAEDIDHGNAIPQQHSGLGVEGRPADQMAGQDGTAGNQPHTVHLGEENNGGADIAGQVPVPAIPQG